jgi:hypothetical protein
VVQYRLGERNSNTCPKGYEVVEYDHACAEAIQWLADVVNWSMPVTNTTYLMKTVLDSNLFSSDQNSVGLVPYGCFADFSTLNGGTTATPKINYNKAGSKPLPSAAPICQSDRQTVEQYAKSNADGTDCEDGYEKIDTVQDCVRATQFLKINLTGGMLLHDTFGLEKYLRTREIGSDSPLGERKPSGCYLDKSCRVINGMQHCSEADMVTEVWLNHNSNGRRHDNSAPICKLKCGRYVPHVKLYAAEDEGQHLRKGAVSEFMGRPFASAMGAFILLVATFALMSAKRQGYFKRSYVSISVDATDLNPDTTRNTYQSLVPENSFVPEREVMNDDIVP